MVVATECCILARGMRFTPENATFCCGPRTPGSAGAWQGHDAADSNARRRRDARRRLNGRRRSNAHRARVRRGIVGNATGRSSATGSDNATGRKLPPPLQNDAIERGECVSRVKTQQLVAARAR